MEEKKALSTQEEIYKLAKENNRMLHAMRRDAFVGGIIKFVWWIAILFVIPYILYVVYLQPYLTNIQAAYQNVNAKVEQIDSATKSIENLKNQLNFGDILKNLGGGGN